MAYSSFICMACGYSTTVIAYGVIGEKAAKAKAEEDRRTLEVSYNGEFFYGREISPGFGVQYEQFPDRQASFVAFCEDSDFDPLGPLFDEQMEKGEIVTGSYLTRFNPETKELTVVRGTTPNWEIVPEEVENESILQA